MDAELLPGAELPLAGVAGEAGQVVDLVVVRDYSTVSSQLKPNLDNLLDLC